MLVSPQLQPALPKAIQRYFEVALYLLVLTGVGSLASTGTLSFPTVVLVGCALLFRGYLLAEKRTLLIPEKWTSFLTIVYIIFYLADYFLISGSFLTSTVNLVLFVMVVRMFSARRDRDHYLLIVISFLMVLASAVLTVDSSFLATFSAFIGMAIITCILMEMRGACAKATFQSANPPEAMAHRRMVFSIVRVVPALLFTILAAGALIFFLLPRVSVGYLSTFSQGTDLTTGFSEHVELGSIGRIQQSNALVMHVAIDGDTAGSFDLKWRGMSLNSFDGRTWSDSHAKYVTPGQSGGKFILRNPEDLAPTKISGPAHAIHYRVLMEPLGSSVFFLAPTPETVQGRYRLLGQDMGGAVFDVDAEHPISQYEATSNIAVPGTTGLQGATGAYPNQILSDYLRIPSLDPRIPKLAQTITAQKGNNYDRALAIESYLRTHFGYTLQLSTIRPRDPLAEFLFVRKQGHCEYFASSMAIMLRSLGIPSRVVNGFRTGEFNDLTSQYLVRESDAHSWVEAYFQGFGWVSFDPTPAGAEEAHTGWSRVMLYMDAMASFWRGWIVSYDANSQTTLERVATRGSQQWLQHVWRRIVREYRRMLSLASRTQSNLAIRPLKAGMLGLLTAAILVLLTGARRWKRILQRARLSAKPEKFPRAAATIWYERMTDTLARHGWPKLPTQTPAEFVASIGDAQVKNQVSTFMKVYESARFGGSTADASSLPHIYQQISNDGQTRKFFLRNSLSGRSGAQVPNHTNSGK